MKHWKKGQKEALRKKKRNARKHLARKRLEPKKQTKGQRTRKEVNDAKCTRDYRKPDGADYLVMLKRQAEEKKQ